MPRTQVVKSLWIYIKAYALKDKKQKTMINAAEKLKAVFGGKKQVSMFEMTKLVNMHLGDARSYYYCCLKYRTSVVNSQIRLGA